MQYPKTMKYLVHK